ncbi:MAG: hypothetical protein KME26_18635 [Oscillatoria princeps RMCB-10]|nr:hypothetical protein [Oscillatoria princeps RMCB-10]
MSFFLLCGPAAAGHVSPDRRQPAAGGSTLSASAPTADRLLLPLPKTLPVFSCRLRSHIKPATSRATIGD